MPRLRVPAFWHCRGCGADEGFSCIDRGFGDGVVNIAVPFTVGEDPGRDGYRCCSSCQCDLRAGSPRGLCSGALDTYPLPSEIDISRPEYRGQRSNGGTCSGPPKGAQLTLADPYREALVLGKVRMCKEARASGCCGSLVRSQERGSLPRASSFSAGGLRHKWPPISNHSFQHRGVTRDREPSSMEVVQAK